MPEKNDQTDDRPRKQADGLDHWARCLEAHDPKGSAAGIVMLHEAAKTLRELASKKLPNSFVIEDEGSVKD